MSAAVGAILRGAGAVALAVLATAGASAQDAYTGYGAGSVAPEVLARHAPPPVDPALAARIHTFLDVRTPGLGLVAPGGRQLFFGWSITGSPQVFRADAPKGFPVQMTGGEDATTLQAVTPDGKWLVLHRDVGGREEPGLYLQATTGGPLVTVQKIAKVGSRFAFVTADGASLYFTANDVAPDSFAIYRYDIATGTRTQVFAEPGLWSVADHKGEGAALTLLLTRTRASYAQEIHEYVPATKVRTPLLGVGESVEYSAAYAAQPGELVVRTNRFGDFRRLYRWTAGPDTAQSSFREVLAPPGRDVAQFHIDDARRYLYAGVNDGGFARLTVLDTATYAPVTLPTPAEADHVYAGSTTPDGRYVTLGIESGRAPRTSYVWDWDTRTLTQWVVPSAPEVDLAAFARVRLMDYPAQDGTRIPMLVRFPKGCAPDEAPAVDPCPVLVDFHGGPEGQARPGFSPYRQIFVDAGYIVVQPNVRGSDGYGRAWLAADDGRRRLDVIDDIAAAGRYIRAHWTRNGRAPRIGVTGGSYGGYATLIAMTMFAGTYDAGVAVYAISDFRTFLRNTAPYRRGLRIAEYGDPDRDAEALRLLSPITYLDRVRAPLLMIQGANDPRTPVGEAVQMQEALAGRGIRSTLIVLGDEGHGAGRRSNQVLEIGHTLRFFDEHLKGPR